MMIRHALLCALLVPATALADPEPASYRRMTITADASGIGLLLLGGLAGAHDDHSPTAGRQALWAIGSTTMLVTPIIHIARGHTERGIGTLLLRAGFAGIGGLVGYAANHGCNDDKMHDPFCDMDYVGYGIVGGLAVASALDAAFMTDETVERQSWSPQAWVTPQSAGGGVALTW